MHIRGPEPGTFRFLPDVAAPRTHSPHAHPSTDTISASPILHLLHAVDGRLMHAAAPSLAMVLDARTAAEKSVVRAAHAVDTAAAHHHKIPDQVDPRAVLALANQFIQTGQYVNYLRAGELGKEVASWYDGPLPVAIGPAPYEAVPHGPWQEALKRLWRRAPLLSLLIGWLLPGLFAGFFLRLFHVPAWKSAIAFEIWGTGFLALVIFQFVASIRGAVANFLHAIIRRH